MSANDEPTSAPLPQEHESILQALRGVERSLDELGQAAGTGWQERARADLREVAASIARHCWFAESPEGLVAEAEREAGRSRHVTEAHREHRQLAELAHELAGALTNDVEAGVLHQRAEELLATLRKHLALEVDLIYDAAFRGERGALD